MKNSALQMFHSALATVALSGLVLTVNDVSAQDQPPIVIRSIQHNGPQIWAQDRAGAPPTNSTATIQAPSGGSGASAAVNPTGSNVGANKNVVAQPSSLVVQGQLTCPAAPKTWSASATCTAYLPMTVAGATAVATDNEAVVNAGRGSATYACQADGTWAATPTGATCSAQCPATTLSWTVSGATCSAAIGPGTSPGSATIVDSTTPGTGQATFTCQATGGWSAPAGASCINNPPPGTYSSDMFLWAVYGHNAGDGDQVAQGGYSIADVDTTTWIDYKLGLHPLVFTGFTPLSITKSGVWFYVGSSAVPYLTHNGSDGSPGLGAYYPQNCVPGVRAVRTAPYSSSRINISGMYCRAGYTP